MYYKYHSLSLTHLCIICIKAQRLIFVVSLFVLVYCYLWDTCLVLPAFYSHTHTCLWPQVNPVPWEQMVVASCVVWCVGDMLAKRQGGAFHLSARGQVSVVLIRFSDPDAHSTCEADCTSTITCLDHDFTVPTFVSEVIWSWMPAICVGFYSAATDFVITTGYS